MGDENDSKAANGKSREDYESDAGEPSNVIEAEGQARKLPYPKSVFFIMSNEFCERFNYYSMRTTLVLYLSRELKYSDDNATVIFHIFTMFVYFLCVFGAIIADSWLGKFKTILYLSMVFICGSVLITLGAIPPLNLPAVTFTMIGLGLIALGSGGIKPCVSAFGGDQFKLPEQVKQMATFFSIFYFSVNAGSLISTLVTPILREDVHCFGEKECYSLAFGVPAILKTLCLIVFVLARPLYKIKPPAGNMVVLVSKAIGNAISTRCKEKKTNPREHWMDYADKEYDRQLIDDVKVLMRVLVLYIPLPFFWALLDQQGSRWTFQATRMDGDMGTWDIKPDQMQVFNPLLILVFIPLYDYILYPALSLIGIRRPLQKLTIGGILAGVAFIISALVELKLEKTYPVLPYHDNAQLRIFNGENCDYTFTTNLEMLNPTFMVKANGYYVNKNIKIRDGKFDMEYSIKAEGENCFQFPDPTIFTMHDHTAYSLFMASGNTSSPLMWYKDYVNKPSRSIPLVRSLANVDIGNKIRWQNIKSGKFEHEEPAYLNNLTELSTGQYKIWVNNKEVTQTALRTGGVYTVLIQQQSNGDFKSSVIEVTEPNSVSILYLIPQYVVMTLGEVMFVVTGIEFSYSQAPLAMKSVLQACWLLTVTFGNIIVVIIAELSLFNSQANEFFLFAGLMFLDMIALMFLAYYYQPNNPMDVCETTPLTDPRNGIDELETDEPKKEANRRSLNRRGRASAKLNGARSDEDLGVDNKAKEIDE